MISKLSRRMQQHLAITALFALALFAVILIIVAYVFNWSWIVNWVAFNGGYGKITTTSTVHGITTATEHPPAKTLWDLLSLVGVLAIPIVVALGGTWYTAQLTKASARENTDNQREAALQAYIDKMSELLLNNKLRGSREDDEVRNIARIRTLTVLRRLDTERKASVLQFLNEAGLIKREDPLVILNGADISGVNLYGTKFSDVNLSGANLSSADLREAKLSDVDLGGADLRSASLLNANLSNANLSNANLSLVDPANLNLRRASLSTPWLDEDWVDWFTRPTSLGMVSNTSGANLRGAKLSNVDLSNAVLVGAIFGPFTKLTAVNLSNAHLRGNNLSGADLRGNNLSNAKLLEINLRGAILSGTNLSGTDLSNADLSNADLSNADLSNADLSGANLSGVRLIKADFSGANLSNANFNGVDLLGANFNEANLSGANLRGTLTLQNQLELVKSLKGAIMTDGLIHP